MNSRKVAEEMQDFLRAHVPDWLPPDAFEFYHRYVDEARKVVIQEHVTSGAARGTPATDVLGMVRYIAILILYMLTLMNRA